MKKGSGLLAAAGASVLVFGSIPALVMAASADRLITSKTVGVVRLGATVAATRKALKSFTLKRASDGDGVALIGVMKNGKPVMTLYAGEDDPSSPIREKAVIQLIEVTDSRYATKAGVRAGMLLKDVERHYGKLKQITTSEIESREFAEFSKSPLGLSFRVLAKSGEAGKYAAGARTASAYTATAFVYSISIRGN